MTMRSASPRVRFCAVSTGVVVLALVVSLTTGCPSAPVGGAGSTTTCLGCHNGRTAKDMRTFLLSSHRGVSCDTCHVGAEAHVQSGGLGGALINPAFGAYELSYAACTACHQEIVEDFQQSGHHVSRSVSCYDCHDVHSPIETIGPFTNNLLCRSCHVFDGFQTESQIEQHTNHSVDPTGTGASRCTSCHMPPKVRTNQDDGPHSHTFDPIPPIVSAEASQNGVTPVPPNSCAGTMGCHDGTVPASPVFNVDNEATMIGLQGVYEMWYGAKSAP